MKNNKEILSELKDIKQYLEDVQDNLNLFADCLMSFLNKRKKTKVFSRVEKMMIENLSPSVDEAIENSRVTEKDIENIVKGNTTAKKLRTEKGKLKKQTNDKCIS